jgi:limonene-1,2-epoxide hydrolase
MILFITVVAVAGCTAQAAGPPPTEKPPALPTVTSAPISAAVVGYAERLSAGDLEGTLAYFDENARMYLLGLPPVGLELYSGKEHIRTMLEDNIANHFKMEVEVLNVDDDVVTAQTTTWHDFTREIGVAPVTATGIYVIKDGKIASEAWHVSEESLAKIKSALAEMMPAEPETEPVSDAPVSEIAVTIAGGTCTYDGPLALQAGKVAVTLDVQDQEKEKYAFTSFNLEADKDFPDLMASTIQTGPPSWAKLLFMDEARPGEKSQFDITVEEGPVYVVCWSSPPDLAIGAIGPFAVVE